MIRPSFARNETPYPMRCPECGRKTAFRRPGRGGMMWLAGAWLLGPSVMAYLGFRQSGSARALTPSILCATVAAALYVLFRNRGGERIVKHGFVLCDACGWTRIGEEEGPRVSRRREAGLALFRRIGLALVAPGLFFLGLTVLGEPTGEEYLLGAVWLWIFSFALAQVFRPQGRSLRTDDRTRFGERPPRG